MLVLDPNQVEQFLQSKEIKEMVTHYGGGRKTLDIGSADDMLTVRRKLDEMKAVIQND